MISHAYRSCNPMRIWVLHDADVTDCKSTPAGRSYTGKTSFSVGGPCLNWTIIDEKRYWLKFDENSFPHDGSAEKAKNYCRNPTNVFLLGQGYYTNLWCVTKVEKKGWGKWIWTDCLVPLCGKYALLCSTFFIIIIVDTRYVASWQSVCFSSLFVRNLYTVLRGATGTKTKQRAMFGCVYIFCR